MAGWLDLEHLPRGLGANWIAPSAALRGAVFSSLVFRGRTTRPAYAKPTLVAEYGHVQVLQTAGEQLDQGDLDVFLELARIGVERDSTRISVGADELLKALGRKRGGESRRWLSESISRLKRASFLFRVPGLHEWETSFLLEFDRNLGTQLVRDYEISLNSRLVALYEKSNTLIRADRRNAIGTDSLGKWLHAFVSSFHRGSETVLKVETVRELSGRKDSRPDRFKITLAETVERLRVVSGWHSIELVGDVLKVQQVENATKVEDKREAAAKKQKATAKSKPPVKKPEAKQAPKEEVDELDAELADLRNSETQTEPEEWKPLQIARDEAREEFLKELGLLFREMGKAGHGLGDLGEAEQAWERQGRRHGWHLATVGIQRARQRKEYAVEKVEELMEFAVHDDI